ncbi:type I-G CRISPR-associated protein Cas8g1/Csx17 [Frigoriglobus tundricola]|uniref:CRISPR-associated protein Csx17 n=1 Tax=Frigoriglobus tundricola TaxID=2774151 RepID=A0A6M5YJD2_9BACT|nr:type I-U CRISPR-associated protein Csx17 [Frigoriglobus tundricola]QJW94167.1 CRISPR-associated protein Csx17 [Frigoriglobus tundricola]
MSVVELPGCTPEPLMSYLKALGVFRLIADQADSSARGCWRGGRFVLETTLSRDSLVKFFSEQFHPSPILAPWNGGSGFYGGGSDPLNAIAHSTNSRLTLYRDTIAAVRQIAPAGKPKDEDKASLLVRCRAALSDEVVPWLDTCFVLGEEGPGYFPLLGTGGNDGRLDFTNNFMQRLADVIAFTAGVPAPAASKGWLASALFANDPALTAYEKAAVGQFNPGGIGGANGVQGNFEANSRVNPWDFVLMIEGALLFAGSVARRLGATVGDRAVFPFTVNSVAVGYGSATASEETTDGSRAELWLPLWDEPARFAEIRQLFGEGRAQVNRRQAKNSIEFALAVNLLGVSRGVTEFSRYGFLKRNGLAFLAAPLGRVPVNPRPAARLLEEAPLRDWLDRLRLACREKDKTPARYQTALRDIDRAIFEFATRSELGELADHRGLLDVLRAVGRAEHTLAGGLAFCKDKYLKPLQGLSVQWLEQANDGSPEFALAASVAGISESKGVGPLRVFLEEVEAKGAYFNWSPGSTSSVWSKRSLTDNLAAVFRRRQMEAFRTGQSGLPLKSPRPASLESLFHFLAEHTDDEKLHDLLWGLSAIDWNTVEDFKLPAVPAPDLAIPFEFGVPRLLVSPFATTDGGETTTPDQDVFHALASGRGDAVSQCVDRAAKRLKSSGLLVNGYRNRYRAGASLGVASAIQPARLLAAMLFPLSDRDLMRIANAVLYPPETQE